MRPSCPSPDGGPSPLSPLVLSLLAPTLARLGWDAVAGESHLDTMLRAAVLPAAASHGDAAVLAEAARRFAAGTIPNNVLGGVLAALVKSDHGTYLEGVLAMHDAAECWWALYLLMMGGPGVLLL
jgi:hypothetical protein